MGEIFEVINGGGITMALLYLNDWSMKGSGTLTSQWSKVERWYDLMTHLSDTYGIAKIGVPSDFKKRELCGYALSNCYIPDNSELSADKRQLLLAIMDSRIQKADYDDSTIRVTNDACEESLCIGKAYEQGASVVSFTFDGNNECATINGTIKANGKSEQTCAVHNLYNKHDVNIVYLVPCNESKQHKAIEEPMWNHEMMEAYCANIGHKQDRKSASIGEKLVYLRMHGQKLAEMNGWVYDENKTKLNHDDEHQRVIFHSGHFRNDDCFLSIDFEKEDFHFELLNHRGKHIREINWHGDKTGDADPSHDIRIKR